jgi:hypothetical protein
MAQYVRVVMDHFKDTETGKKCRYVARRPKTRAVQSDAYLQTEPMGHLEGGLHPPTITVFIYGGAHEFPPE